MTLGSVQAHELPSQSWGAAGPGTSFLSAPLVHHLPLWL